MKQTQMPKLITSSNRVRNISTYANNLPYPHTSSAKKSIVVDRGVTNHFLEHRNLVLIALPIQDIQKATQAIKFLFPNKAIVPSTHK